MEPTNIKQKKKHIVLRTVLITTFINILIVIFLIFLTIGIPRWSRPYTTYIPFSGKLFNINAEEVDKIAIYGYEFREYTMEDAEFYEIIDFMNSFRYSRFAPIDSPVDDSGRVTHTGAGGITINGDYGSSFFLCNSAGFSAAGSWFGYGYWYYPESPIDFEGGYNEITNQPPRITQSPKPIE